MFPILHFGGIPGPPRLVNDFQIPMDLLSLSSPCAFTTLANPNCHSTPFLTINHLDWNLRATYEMAIPLDILRNATLPSRPQKRIQYTLSKLCQSVNKVQLGVLVRKGSFTSLQDQEELVLVGGISLRANFSIRSPMILHV